MPTAAAIEPTFSQSREDAMAAVTVPLMKPPYLNVPEAVMRPLVGYGAQMFTDLFLGGPQIPSALANHLGPLSAGHSRIFVEPVAVKKDGPRRKALLATLAFAERAGANVNLTWWSGPYFRDPNNPSEAGYVGDQLMTGFADFLLSVRKKFACVTHVTIQNEPNSHDIGREHKVQKSFAVYDRLYRKLSDELKARPDPRAPAKKLRSAFQLVGGDLVLAGPDGIRGSNQDDWIRFMQKHMRDVLDGYSIHVYWRSGDYNRFETRLANLIKLQIGKPVYITEYGVRGPDFGTPDRMFEQGSLHGKNVEDSIESGFQHAWFNALAPQYGAVGFAKWACYRIDTGKTKPAGPRRPQRDAGMICGVGRNFDTTHNYRVTALFNQIAGKGSKAAAFGKAGDVLVSVFALPNGHQSAVVLNRAGTAADVQLTGKRLIPNRSYNRAAWNQSGDGLLTQIPKVTADASGNTVVRVAGHSLAALSTRALN
jgi:hypothetical protein